MKPSNHNTLRALLWIIPVSIYTAAMGWSFALALVGFIILGHSMNRLAEKILPQPVKEKKP